MILKAERLSWIWPQSGYFVLRNRRLIIKGLVHMARMLIGTPLFILQNYLYSRHICVVIWIFFRLRELRKKTRREPCLENGAVAASQCLAPIRLVSEFSSLGTSFLLPLISYLKHCLQKPHETAYSLWCLINILRSWSIVLLMLSTQRTMK